MLDPPFLIALFKIYSTEFNKLLKSFSHKFFPNLNGDILGFLISDDIKSLNNMKDFLHSHFPPLLEVNILH